jgi:hypothetical protein
MTKSIVAVFLFLLMFSSGALSNEQCGTKSDKAQCPLELELKEGKGEVIEAGHFNLLWTDTEEHKVNSGSAEVSSRDSESSVAKSSVVKDTLLDQNSHSATHLTIATEQSFSEISHHIKIHSTQRAISLTGFNNGHYFVRLFDAEENPVSNIVEVEVQHHSMGRVWVIFISGAVLFLILIGYMVAKVFRHKEE